MSQWSLATTVAKGDISFPLHGATKLSMYIVSCLLGHSDSETEFVHFGLFHGMEPIATMVAKGHCDIIEHMTILCNEGN